LKPLNATFVGILRYRAMVSRADLAAHFITDWDLIESLSTQPLCQRAETPFCHTPFQ
jgi:hypothetical protein